MRRTLFAGLFVTFAFAACDTAPTAPEVDPQLSYGAEGGDERTRLYRVTVHNLTSTQPFTPPLIATHDDGVRLFRPGQRASEGVKEIAENGNLGPMLDALAANDDVSAVVVALSDPPPLLQGASVSIEIEAGEDAAFLSWISMLICTNDGFTGRRIRLPRRIGKARTAYARAFDAGTERNTEDFADIVPPCQIFGATMSDDAGTGMSDPSIAEHRRIRRHRGIRGGNDLTREDHGWRGAVAKVVVERIG